MRSLPRRPSLGALADLRLVKSWVKAESYGMTPAVVEAALCGGFGEKVAVDFRSRISEIFKVGAIKVAKALLLMEVCRVPS